MITVKSDFQKRKSEINEYLEFIEVIYAEEKEIEIMFKKQVKHKRKQKFQVSDQLQKVLIANSFLLLYNLIEATIRNSIDEIFADLQNNTIDYTRLTDKLKKIFLVQKNKNLKDGSFNLDTLNKQIDELISSVLNTETIILDKAKLDFSGNLDAKKIRTIASDYGFGQPAVNGDNLLVIKNKRNHLAHGDFSFSEIGKDFTVSELLDFKDQTFIFLNEVINNIEVYIVNKEYSNAV
jgi:hypothetical protein